MTRVDFNLRDFPGMAWGAGTVPELTFRPSGPGVDAWGVYAGTVTVPASDGHADLVPTVAMHGDVYYSMEVSWLEGGRVRREFWPHKIRVPETGPVELVELVDLAPHELYQRVEVSHGTTDLGGNPLPHSAQTDIWLKLGADAGIYVKG